MKCSEARARLQPLVDGVLGATEAARTRQHLAVCERCQQEYALLRLADESLSTQPAAEPPLGLAATISAKARARGAERRPVLVPAWMEGWTLGAVGIALTACGAAALRYFGAEIAGPTASGAGARLVVLGLAAGYGLFGFWYYRP